MDTIAYIGYGFVIILFIFLAILHRKKNPLGIDKCVYRGDEDDPIVTLEPWGLYSPRRPPPSDRQSRLSYPAKMTIIALISLLVIIPLFCGIYAICLLTLNKVMENNGFSENDMAIVGLGGLLIFGSLYMIFIHTVCICFNKRLPRHSIRGKVCKKRIDKYQRKTDRYSNSSLGEGYIWTGIIPGWKKLCVITISHKDGYSDFYVPQKIYDNVYENDSVNLIYNELSDILVVIDIIH